MFCMKCGQELPDNAGFCFKCGQPVSKQSESEEVYEEKLFANSRNSMHDIIKEVNRWLRTEKPNLKEIQITTMFGHEGLLHGGLIANQILFKYTTDQEKSYILGYVMDASHRLPKLEAKIINKMKK